MKANPAAPWNSLASTGLFLVILGMAEFIYLWLGQHLSLNVLQEWLQSLVEHFLG